MTILDVVLAIAAILVAAYFYLKYTYLDYWKRQGLPYLEPDFFYGNTKKVIKGQISFADQFLEIYQRIKSRGLRHGGAYMFFGAFYVPIDPEIIKSILHKDFDHFMNHGLYHNEEADPLNANLFNLEDAQWRDLRVKLTPTFTSGKLKMMFQTLVACSDGLKEVLNKHSVAHDAVDIKDVVSRFTTDIIGSCAFGLDCNSLKNPDSEFRHFGNKLFAITIEQKLRIMFSFFLPKRFLRLIGFRMIDKEVESFFMNVVRDTINYREKNQIYRKDFMHLMLQLKNRGKVSDDDKFTDSEENNGKKQEYLTFNEFAAQCFVFFVAGFETSSTLMTFALYRLTENIHVQEKLREEILAVLKKHDNNLTYDAVMEMTYLDKVINETLRINPPVPATPRVCNKPYRVPGTDFTLERGVTVNIPIYGIHMDPEYYPQPEEFDPERFSEENKSKRPPCTFLPFGDGPRICIGLRFGIMQAKVGLINIIKDYIVTLNEKTKTPIKLDHKSGLMVVEGGVWLNVAKIN